MNKNVKNMLKNILKNVKNECKNKPVGFQIYRLLEKNLRCDDM